jgi:hypothetical protein
VQTPEGGLSELKRVVVVDVGKEGCCFESGVRESGEDKFETPELS